MIGWIIVGVVFVTLIVGLIKSAQNWTWVTILAVVLVFITSVLGSLTISQTLLTREAWVLKDRLNQRLLNEAQAAYLLLLNGAPDSIGFPADSHHGMNNRVNLMSIGQGRIWHSGQPVVEGDQIKITYTQTAADGTTGLASQLKQDMTVFVFADRSITIEDQPVSVPVQYVGSFLVTAVDAAGNSLLAKPLFVTQLSLEESKTPTSSWTLFEKMPGDSRTVFLDDLGLESFDITSFRNALRDKYLTAESVGLAPDSKEYEALLDEYAFDGLPMNEIMQWIASQQGRINENFDPISKFRESRVKSTEKREFEVDGTGNLVSDGPFDQQGRANDPALHYGKNVVVEKDTELLISKDVVTGYDRVDGSPEPKMPGVDEIVDYYSRPLRDYPFSIQEYGEQAQRLSEAIESLKADIAITQEVIENTKAQIDRRADMTLKLQSDIGRREQELALITSHGVKLEAEIAKRQQEIRTFYEQIMELYKSSNGSGQNQDTRIPSKDDSAIVSQR